MASVGDQLIEILPKLRRFACSLAGTISEGDDLLQNAVERALKRQASFDSNRKLESWMYAITKNIWIDELRSRKRRGITVDIDDQYGLQGEDGRVITEQKIMTEKVLKAMNELPERQHLVAYHVLVDGNSYKETATILDIPLGTVMSNLSRARKTLAKKVLGEGLLQ
ncbi:MAG: RNA polymerase sigma factor [Gammaproteobacteria bacterium]|nr:RNA polymerase sigma factor [Gammaproteobacteria bacterium]